MTGLLLERLVLHIGCRSGTVLACTGFLGCVACVHRQLRLQLCWQELSCVLRGTLFHLTVSALALAAGGCRRNRSGLNDVAADGSRRHQRGNHPARATRAAAAVTGESWASEGHTELDGEGGVVKGHEAGVQQPIIVHGTDEQPSFAALVVKVAGAVERDECGGAAASALCTS